MASGAQDGPILEAIRRAVADAGAQGGILPVRAAARRILAETASEPAALDAIIEALCQECIRQGVIIEFQRPDN